MTNLRMMWLANSNVPSSCHIPLAAIVNAGYKDGGLFNVNPPRLKLAIRLDSAHCPAGDTQKYARIGSLKITSRRSNLRTLHHFLEAAVMRREWLALPAPISCQLFVDGASPTKPKEDSPLKLGAYAMGAVKPLPLPNINFEADIPTMLELCKMGYAPEVAANALIATQNGDVSDAIEWLSHLENEELAHAPNDYSLNGCKIGTAAGSMLLAASKGIQRSHFGAGVAGVLKDVEHSIAQEHRELDEAFSRDLQGLMAKAKDMVDLAKSFRQNLGDIGESMDAAIASDLVDIGFITPVTRETAGKAYSKEVARQLADFLTIRKIVEGAGGLIPLQDAYCLYNRARGSELISPEDLYRAASLFKEIHSPYELREFPSGIKVIQAISHTDDAVCQEIQKLVNSSRDLKDENFEPWHGALGHGISRVQVAEIMQIPLAVAAEHLLTVERRGILCRDESSEGLRFYPNFYLTL